jgi:hypothetical protein
LVSPEPRGCPAKSVRQLQLPVLPQFVAKAGLLNIATITAAW